MQNFYPTLKFLILRGTSDNFKQLSISQIRKIQCTVLHKAIVLLQGFWQRFWIGFSCFLVFSDYMMTECDLT